MPSGNAARSKERLSVKEIEKWLRSPERQAGHKLADGGGLYLTFLPSGRASWQVRYSHGGKLGTFSIGPSDEVSLADARAARRKIKDQVAEGVDPVTERRAKRAEGETSSGATFKSIAEQWLKKQREDGWSDIHYTKSERALERDVFPALGELPVARISTLMVAAVIKKVQARGVRDTAQKLLQHVRSVFRYAQAIGLRQDNPAEPVIEVLQRSPDVAHHPALLTFDELGDVLRRAEAANITPAVRLCHRLIAFTAVRVSNAVEARWEHFKLEQKPALWCIPRDEMKVGKGRTHAHTVILPEQLVRELRRWRSSQPEDAVYVFPGAGGRDHLSREAVEKALRVTLGLANKHSPHGWRSAFSTRAREDKDFEGELIDLALDHVHASDVARAYDRGQRLEKRVALAEWWGNELARAEHGADVLPLSSTKAVAA